MDFSRWIDWGVFLVLIALISGGCQRSELTGIQSAPGAADASLANGPVTMHFELPDGVRTVVIDNVADSSLLDAVLRQVKDLPIQMSGTGKMTFVDSIGGVSTDARQGWTFTVDDQYATAGVGSIELHPPTTVRWKFGEFEAVSEGSAP